MSTVQRTRPNTAAEGNKPQTNAARLRPQTSEAKTANCAVVLQLFLYVSYAWSPLYFVISIATFTFKAIRFPYPLQNAYLAVDIVIFAALIAFDGARIYVLTRGNLRRNSGDMGLAIFFCLLVGAGLVYMLIFETYVLYIDFVINLIGLIIDALELITALVHILIIASNKA